MINKAVLSTGKDDWETPPEFFDELNNEFHFTIDPCANEKNHKCERYYTVADNGLLQDWAGEVVFCNPPYSPKTKTNPGQGAWIKKCYEEAQKPNTTVVALIPARTDTKAFHQYIYHKAKEIRFLKGRLKFVGAKSTAPFPSMVVIF